MKIKTIIILIIIVIIFSGNVVFSSQNTLNELNNTKETIISSSISGFFTVLGVFIGFLGIYINNKLSYNNSKKEAIYKILLKKYKEIAEIFDEFSNLETDITYTNFQKIIEDYSLKPEAKCCAVSYNEFLKQVGEIIKIHDKATKFVSENTIILHKNLKINIEKEWKNMFYVNIFDFYIELESIQEMNNIDEIIQHGKNFVDDLQKVGKSIFNIKVAIEEKLF